MSYPQTNNSSLVLRAKTTKAAIEKADAHLQASMKGEHKVLRTRWEKINRMLLGGFHFGQIYYFCGASGHGKSYFLNMVQRDFINSAVNSPKFSFKILHFGFEMGSDIELLRRVSSITKIPYRRLIASDEMLTNAEYEKVQRIYSTMKEEPIYYFEEPGTRLQIEATIEAFHKRFPDDLLVVTLDHTLLVLDEKGEDELKTLSELGKMFIRLKKRYNLLTILLGQLNDKIESEKRRDPTNPVLHFPVKTDIHGSKQIYHAADVVMVGHQPSLLGLETYGRHHFPTKDLFVVHMLKQRNGQQGYTLMDNNLKNGEFTEKILDKKERMENVKSALEGRKKIKN